MKNRIIVLLVIAGLFWGTSTFAGISPSIWEKEILCQDESMEISFVFTEPRVENEDGAEYAHILTTDEMIYDQQYGFPMMPYATKVITLPLGATVEKITVDIDTSKTMKISRKIVPASKPIITGDLQKNSEERWENGVYNSNSFYPLQWVNSDVGVGRNNNDLTLFLTLHIFPIRYNPVENVLLWINELKVTIDYQVKENPLLMPEIYDLLIISPEEFTEKLEELVIHKENHGVNTTLVTTNEIYTGTFFPVEGRDDAEKVKYFIKNSIEEWGIKYVLLVGGMKGQQYTWYVPVRYTNNHAGKGSGETGFLSDLYYADIYKYENGEILFEDWDSNKNGVFAEFRQFAAKDIMDCRPDVYVGRLACRDSTEVEIMVNKIITYESGPCDPSWFKKMLLVGGDTYPNLAEQDAYEAEIDTNLSGSYMPSYEKERLWASLGTLTGQADVEQAFNQGAGFIHMAGHANPGVLVTYPPQTNTEKIVILQVYNIPPANAIFALSLGDIQGFFDKLNDPWMPHLENGDKLPVVLVGGCHNSQFNTSLLNIIRYGFLHAYGYGIYVPNCWSWWLTSLKDGGAIATLGNTGLGMGLGGYNYTEGLDGWLFPRFFYHHGIQGIDILGEAHSSAIIDYTNTFDINSDDADRQMITQWALLGDPSLKMGGYT